MTIRDRIFGNDDRDSEEDNMTEETTDDEESETPEDAQKAYEEARDNDKEEEEEQSDEEDEVFVEDVTLVFTRELSFEYTEHDAVVTFMDGTEEEYTFDKMNKSSNDIVLKDYTDELEAKRSGLVGGLHTKPKGSLAFATIERQNMKSFETTERRKKEIEQEFNDKKEVPRPEAEEYVEEHEDAFIMGDEDDEE